MRLFAVFCGFLYAYNGALAADHTMMHHASSTHAEHAPYDLQFLDTMIVHHEAAVEMAKLALNNAADDDIKNMSRDVIDSQQKEISEMKSLRGEHFGSADTAVNMEMAGMHDSMKGMDMNALHATKGKKFDELFIAQMIPHHKGALDMCKEADEKAQLPAVKKLCAEIVPAQSAEIAMMRKKQD